MSHRTVLVGMSIADALRRDEMTAWARANGASIAFLQQAEPSLSAELTRLADDGATTITLVGIDQGPIAPARSWVRRIAGHWWREWGGTTPAILVATRLARSVDEIDRALDDLRGITGDEPGLTSAAWESVSGHRHQVMICRGPRCTAMGATDNLRAMVMAMIEHNLGDDDVLMVHTGCQFPCNQAPVVNVQPDDVWYGSIDPTGAAAIVSEHLIGGRPVEALRLPR